VLADDDQIEVTLCGGSGDLLRRLALGQMDLGLASGLGVCPPAVEYSREFQARAAEELMLLPAGSVIMDMLGDYAVMREQARACAAVKS